MLVRRLWRRREREVSFARFATFASSPPPTCSFNSFNLSSIQQLRYQARRLYKEVSLALPFPSLSSRSPTYPGQLAPLQLFYLAKEYPDPNYPIHKKLHACFLAHVGGDEEKLTEGIKKAEFIKKGELVSFQSVQSIETVADKLLRSGNRA